LIFELISVSGLLFFPTVWFELTPEQRQALEFASIRKKVFTKDFAEFIGRSRLMLEFLILWILFQPEFTRHSLNGNVKDIQRFVATASLLIGLAGGVMVGIL